MSSTQANRLRSFDSADAPLRMTNAAVCCHSERRRSRSRRIFLLKLMTLPQRGRLGETRNDLIRLAYGQPPSPEGNGINLSEIKCPIGPSGHFPTAVGKHLPAMRQPMAPCRSGELSAKLTEGHPFPVLKLMTLPLKGKAFGRPHCRTCSTCFRKTPSSGAARRIVPAPPLDI